MILEKKYANILSYRREKIFKMQSKGMMNAEFISVYLGGDMGLEG